MKKENITTMIIWLFQKYIFRRLCPCISPQKNPQLWST